MPRLNDLENPLAITMWDSTWNLAHYPRGSFEDWDRALDEAVERDYNAIRIECYPHLVARDAQGGRADEFFMHRNNDGLNVWEPNCSIHINPRKELAEFIPKCAERGIYVGLSSWFRGDASGRPRQVEGVEAFVRVWDETLQFVRDEVGFDNIIYVDLLNEYPLWHGWWWLTKQIQAAQELDSTTAYTDKHRQLYRTVIHDALGALKQQWPDLDFFVSQTQNAWEDDRDMDYSNFDALDIHLWFAHCHDLSRDTGYYDIVHGYKDDTQFHIVQKKLTDRWAANRDAYIEWMDKKIAGMCEVARKWKLPIGNTEGWGMMFWCDHPGLNWDFTKEAAEICLTLGAKYGYKFNCTSNYAQPRFGFWDDVAWHKRMNGIVRGGGKMRF